MSLTETKNWEDVNNWVGLTMDDIESGRHPKLPDGKSVVFPLKNAKGDLDVGGVAIFFGHPVYRLPHVHGAGMGAGEHYNGHEWFVVANAIDEIDRNRMCKKS